MLYTTWDKSHDACFSMTLCVISGGTVSVSSRILSFKSLRLGGRCGKIFSFRSSLSYEREPSGVFPAATAITLLMWDSFMSHAVQIKIFTIIFKTKLFEVLFRHHHFFSTSLCLTRYSITRYKSSVQKRHVKFTSHILMSA